MSLLSVGQMKRIVNASKKFILMIVKPKESDSNGDFEVWEPMHKHDLIKVIFYYDEIFQEPQGLPPKREVKHEIQLLQDAPLPNLSLYKLLVIENEEVKKQVQELMEKGFIYPSYLPRRSPKVLLPNKYGAWCVCMDYRALNKITVKNRYPLPRIDDLLDQLKIAVYFTKLDLRIHHIRIHEDDIDYLP